MSFDAKAKDWDSKEDRVERARVFGEAIRRRIPALEGMTALEYGCGTGLLSFTLQPFLSHITCADSSRGMLDVLDAKIAAAGATNMSPREIDLARDPLPSERFNLIYTLMVLHHIPNTASILKSFYDLLTRPGYLCIGDLDHEDGSFHSSEFQGHHGFDRNQLAEMCRSVGFSTVDSSIVFTMLKERDGVRKEYPLFLSCAEKR